MSTRAIIPAATVVLLREEASAGVEVFLLRRHRASSFMSNAYVFPGGKIDAADGGAQVAAVRELFEEAGVLLAEPLPPTETLAEARQRLNAGEVSFSQVLALSSASPDPARLHFWARWVTPSAEPKRFDATFFLAELPPGQHPSFDAKETVDELWITPAEALARQAAGTLRLPPPQLRTMYELRAAGDLGAIRAEAARRQETPAPICPKIAMGEDGVQIVLPWDPGYLELPGDGDEMPPGHPQATPPSRFVWTGSAWREV
jgi:8-oxo-dGTP pyrophosphatase MutT (NUDIX family)